MSAFAILALVLTLLLAGVGPRSPSSVRQGWDEAFRVLGREYETKHKRPRLIWLPGDDT